MGWPRCLRNSLVGRSRLDLNVTMDLGLTSQNVALSFILISQREGL